MSGPRLRALARWALAALHGGNLVFWALSALIWALVTLS